MQKNYTKEIRKTLEYIYTTMSEYISNRYGIYDEERIKQSVLLALNLSEEKTIQSDIQYVGMLSIITMIRNQMFTDLYKSMNLKKIYEQILKLLNITEDELLYIGGNENYKEKFYLDELKSHMEVDKRLKLSKNIYSAMSMDMLNEILDFKKKSVYEKILQAKALSEDDIKLLSDNNPYFEEEIKSYDVPITKEFIIDRINRLNASKFKDDNEKTYEETADFIFRLAKMTEPGESVLNQLVMEYPNSILKECTDNEFIFLNVGGKIYKSNLKNVLKEITKKEPNKIKKKNTKE